MDYIVLRKKVTDAGLLDRQYLYYAFKIVTTLAMVLGFGFLLFTSVNIFVQLLAVAGLGFSFVQVSMLGHDAGHLAIFKSNKMNDLTGLLTLSLFVGTSYYYWVSRHNAHHANPNHEDDDPDVEIGRAHV